ncbi:MAG TPA: 6-phosphogluconolactonase [Terriglobales bacterium]|nr:6-phosphogluconolactonase [Terriglobales bacterium]
MADREIILCRDANELAQKAADQFVVLAGQARGRFSVALSGGSTPKALYSLLASPDYRARVDWARVHLFWGDERCVAPDHPESNYRMVREALLSGIPMPPENIHRMAGEIAPENAAAIYAAEIARFFQLDADALPRFDLALLGLGEDGHTASLFPGTSAPNEKHKLVTSVYVERLNAHRLTITLPVINAAAQVSFLVAGESKAAIVNALLGQDSNPAQYPAGQIRPANGKLTWFITQDAGGRIVTSL